MTNLLPSIVQTKEDPGCQVDQQVGDDSEPVPHRGQHCPHTLTACKQYFFSMRAHKCTETVDTNLFSTSPSSVHQTVKTIWEGGAALFSSMAGFLKKMSSLMWHCIYMTVD